MRYLNFSILVFLFLFLFSSLSFADFVVPDSADYDPYYNSDYSDVCDCVDAWNQFIDDVQSSDLFSILTFDSLANESGSGDSFFSFYSERFHHDFVLDLADYENSYPAIAGFFTLLASVVSVRIIAMKE